MCLNKQLRDHNHRVELYVKDLNYWINFYKTHMGFHLIKMEASTALLWDGYTLLEIGEEQETTGRTSKQTLEIGEYRAC
jgi:catechol 2,3-dioxygenase-like lactoylglutathione lyase family enzyme